MASVHLEIHILTAFEMKELERRRKESWMEISTKATEYEESLETTKPLYCSNVLIGTYVATLSV